MSGLWRIRTGSESAILLLLLPDRCVKMTHAMQLAEVAILQPLIHRTKHVHERQKAQFGEQVEKTEDRCDGRGPHQDDDESGQLSYLSREMMV